MRFFPYERLLSMIATIGLLIVLGFAGYAGLRLTQAQIAADVYRDRLTKLSTHYDQLRSQYNEAVRRTAVTELVVENGRLSVHVRTAEGLLKTIPTNLDPYQEIYVDYLVLDGRLWIRRLFDDLTPPASGVLIDPELGEINWRAPHVSHGKAVYRQLDEGRWIVTVTGSGALGLTRAEQGTPVDLTPPPEIRDYDQIETEIQSQVDNITMTDIIRRLLGR